nr:photosystem I subunit VIII [Euphorbia pekinensis]UBT68433.1 photosystem I subunit VIII [Euphorbia pekinensis]
MASLSLHVQKNKIF